MTFKTIAAWACIVCLFVGCRRNRGSDEEKDAGTGTEGPTRRDGAGSPAPTVRMTHVVISNTPYYLSSPAQARPAEGMLSEGTWVAIVSEQGSYVRVTTKEGITAYVSRDSIRRPESANGSSGSGGPSPFDSSGAAPATRSIPRNGSGSRGGPAPSTTAPVRAPTTRPSP